MRVVLDTNILISACWKPGGLEAQTVGLALSGAIVPCVSPPVWTEYADVLSRRKFAALLDRSGPLLDALQARASVVHPAIAIEAARDADDNRFLECAAAAHAAFLITGNLRHYPAQWGATAVVNARQFFELHWRQT